MVVFLALAATAHGERSVVFLGQPKERVRLDNDGCRSQSKIDISQCLPISSYTGAQGARVLSLCISWPIVLCQTLEEVKVSS